MLNWPLFSYIPSKKYDDKMEKYSKFNGSRAMRHKKKLPMFFYDSKTIFKLQNFRGKYFDRIRNRNSQFWPAALLSLKTLILKMLIFCDVPSIYSRNTIFVKIVRI